MTYIRCWASISLWLFGINYNIEIVVVRGGKVLVSMDLAAWS